MKKIYIAFMTVAALAAVSCNTKEEFSSLPTREVMFTAVQADDPESKTILQSDGSVFWSAGDSINLFYGTAGSAKLISNNSEPVQQTTFSGSLGGYNHNGSDYFHAVYPYSAENTFDGTAFTVTLPEVQSSVAGSFADDLFISMARSQDYTLQFYNLCGGVKFSVAEAGIKYVTFRGNNNEPLAGKVNVSFNDDGKPVVQTVVDGRTELRLDAPDGGTFEPGEWYYMVSLPATLSAGYTMTFYKDEKFAERITDSSISIKRAVWGRLTNADGIHTKPEAVDLGLPSGLKWASFNLGANVPEEAGLFFAWGEIQPKSGEGTWENYKYGESRTVLSKYNEEDGLTELLLEDDAAHILLGEGWRIPTQKELDELDSYCTETLTSRNGVDGYEFVSDINHNSIFIPFYSEDSDGYWSKTLSTNPGYQYAWCLHLEKEGPSYTHASYGSWRCRLMPIRPVSDEGVRVSVTGITLNKSSLTLAVEKKMTITATVAPSNATQKTLIWSSSNTSVATVSWQGVVTAVAAGTATIIAKTYDGGFTATCDVIVFDSAPEPSAVAVDLGLPSGLKWASCNVGASAPEYYGDYFAWGGTEPQGFYNSATCPFCTSGTVKFSKYNTSTSYGTVDNNTVLDPEDDAAAVNWGGSWRMPTIEEWTELRTECTWTWTTQNGINGRLVTGLNGNSIFLPAAGYWVDACLYYAGSYGFYWSSSLSTDYPYYACSVSFYSGSVGWYDYNRYRGQSVRAVSDDGVRVSVTGISLNKSSLTLAIEEAATITATVSPANATQKNVIWSSSNTSVATVSWQGVVTAVAPGTTTITATTYDGGFTATCGVTVFDSAPEPTAVDLGLTSGLKWASCNVGANAPEEYGDYFAWGETEPYYTEGHSQDDSCSNWKDGKTGYNWASYKWCNGSYSTLTKYNYSSSYGTVDNKYVLVPEDDAAAANWGGSWRMPTDAEWTELRTECTWTWTTQNGVNGRLVTGPNGNSIFLPAAGGRYDTGLYYAGSNGRYWSSSLYTGYPSFAYYVYFSSGNVFWDNNYRYSGQSVRPVTE